jgi:hypothetical protein
MAQECIHGGGLREGRIDREDPNIFEEPFRVQSGPVYKERQRDVAKGKAGSSDLLGKPLPMWNILPLLPCCPLTLIRSSSTPKEVPRSRPE